MQDYITREILDEFGIKIPDGADEKMLLETLNDELAARVGREIAEEIDDEKFDEMVALQESDDAEKLQKFLAENVENLAEIVEDERDILLGEIAENAEKLNEIAAS